MSHKPLLFNPGPTNVSEEVRNALLTPDMNHRDPAFKEVIAKVNETLVNILGGEHTHSAVFFVSSGTGANEAMINGIHGKILGINHGRYSSRLCSIAKRYQIPLVDFFVPELDLLDLNALENLLKNDPDITHIMVVHHETTTGMLEPLKEIGQLSKKYGKTLLVDGISSIGSHSFNLQEFNIGFCTVTANKCLEGIPGVSFVIAKNEELKKLSDKARSFYFDLYHQWECQQNKKMPYTAAVQVVFALDVALQRLLREGYENRIQRYSQLASKMRQGLKNLGFELIEHPSDRQASFLVLMKIPGEINYYVLRNALQALNITIYSDKDSVNKGRMFVAVMGDITSEDIDFFLHTLKSIMMEQACLKKETAGIDNARG